RDRAAVLSPVALHLQFSPSPGDPMTTFEPSRMPAPPPEESSGSGRSAPAAPRTDVRPDLRDVERQTLLLKQAEDEIRKVIVGQSYLIDRLLVGLLCRGHLLIEGVPGLAKTLAVKTLARTLDIDFRRVQFTPDLLPADLVGTL